MSSTATKSSSDSKPTTVPASLHNEPVDGLGQLASTAQDALTDSMVERLAVAGGNFLEVADRLNDEETRDAIHALLDQLTELHRTGALTTLFELVKVLHAARDAATDSIIERLFSFVENMLNNVATEEMAALVGSVQQSMEEALQESAEAPKKGGMNKIYSMMKTPEGLRALHFIIVFVNRMQANASGEQAGAAT